MLPGSVRSGLNTSFTLIFQLACLTAQAIIFVWLVRCLVPFVVAVLLWKRKITESEGRCLYCSDQDTSEFLRVTSGTDSLNLSSHWIQYEASP